MIIADIECDERTKPIDCSDLEIAIMNALQAADCHIKDIDIVEPAPAVTFDYSTAEAKELGKRIADSLRDIAATLPLLVERNDDHAES